MANLKLGIVGPAFKHSSISRDSRRLALTSSPPEIFEILEFLKAGPKSANVPQHQPRLRMDTPNFNKAFVLCCVRYVTRVCVLVYSGKYYNYDAHQDDILCVTKLQISRFTIHIALQERAHDMLKCLEHVTTKYIRLYGNCAFIVFLRPQCQRRRRETMYAVHYAGCSLQDNCS